VEKDSSNAGAVWIGNNLHDLHTAAMADHGHLGPVPHLSCRVHGPDGALIVDANYQNLLPRSRLERLLSMKAPAFSLRVLCQGTTLEAAEKVCMSNERTVEGTAV
jgi:hypothetical protein